MGEGQKAPNFLDDRILASCKVFTSDRLLPFEPGAFSSFHGLWLSFCFPTLTHFLFTPGEIVTRVFIEPSRTVCTNNRDGARVG